MDVYDRPALEWVARALRPGDVNGRGGAAENLEQHAHRDESGAPPAIAAQGPHGRALQSNQSAFLVQYTEHRFLADSLRSGFGARRRSEARQHLAEAPTQA